MNMIELQNMPRLNRSEKATHGIASVIVEDGHIQVWDGSTREHNFTGEPLTMWAISDDGELVKPAATEIDLDNLSAMY